MSGPLIEAQLRNCGAIDKFIKNFKKCAKANLTIGYLKGRLEGLHDQWKKFEELHDQIELLEEGKSSSYIIEDTYSTYEELYYHYVGVINTQLESLAVAKPVPTNNHNNHSEVKLPPIDIPKFSGSFAEWRTFHDLFCALVGQNAHLDDVQRMFYLKASVSGEAEQMLRCYSISESNYATAWKALCNRYDNTRLLINAQLSLLLNTNVIQKETAGVIRNLHDATVESMASLDTLGLETKYWDVAIIHVQTQRLPPETRKLWEQQISSQTEPPTIKQYLDFLESRFRTLEALSPAQSRMSVRKQALTILNTSSTPFAKCVCCQHDHNIRQCQQFQSLSPDKRLQFAKKKTLCFNCLAQNHSTNRCPSKKGCYHCGRRHHTLLHLNSPSHGPSVAPFGDPVTSLHVTNQCNQVLLSTAIIKAKGNGREHTLRALIDTGSQASFITTSAMQRLRLVPSSIRAIISGIGNASSGATHKLVHFQFSSRSDDSYSIPVEAIVLPSLTDQIPQKPLSLKTCPHLVTLNLADPSFHKPGQIDVILGADIYPYIIRDGIKIGDANSPIAQNTMLGWILLGPTTSDVKPASVYTFFNKVDLDYQLRRFWEMEEVEAPFSISEDDAKCEEHFQNTHTRNDEGRYVVALPFKSSPEYLGSSYHRAVMQLNSLHRRLNKDPQLKEAYTQCIQEFINLGHMKKIDFVDINDDKHYYLPHHGVVKPTSTTTKLRVVFNASSKTSSGKSLNDLLYTGPSLQRDIASVIMRNRMYRIAAAADMKKMFLQIRVTDQDSDFQRIVWQYDLDSPVEHFRLQTVTFGVASAPFLAMRTIQQLVEDDCKDYELAARVFREQLYVDNVLFGADDIQEVLETQRQLITLLEGGGFELRQWASNVVDVINRVPEIDLLSSPTVNISTEPASVNTLGLLWNPADDTLLLRVQDLQNLQANSKRSVLSGVSKLFDPLGWFAPIIIVGKILIKQLWILDLDWDEPLPPKEQDQWNQFHSNLGILELITLPRWIHTTRRCSIQLHGFCDSSENAYAAVIYIRVQNEHDENSKISILMAKTKVAPVKTISLPRLELCGATLLSALVKRIQRDMNLAEVPIYCWSDSTIVLAWLKQQPCHWKTFVANRVSLIRDRIPSARWYHVPSKENPADVATRGSSPDALRENTLWWNGPSWLVYPSECWPKQRTHSTTDELRKIVTLTTNTTYTEPIIMLTNYSSYKRLIRVTAYCLRFISNIRKERVNRQTAHLQTEELDRALQYWIQLEQIKYEIETLKTNGSAPSQRAIKKAIKKAIKGVPKNPKKKNKLIKSLTPFLDKNETLRVGGRLRHADLPYDQKHPILLSHNSHLAKLIVAQCHMNTFHGGTTLMMAKIRQTYWITKLRTLVRSCIHHCIKCFRLMKQTSQQLMGDLPKVRITPARPFSSTGIDFAGPLSLRMSKGRNCKTYKGYISVFVCLATKAVHLEAVSDLTTDALLAALRRFFARRGLSKNIYSDCGTNFIGAKAILDKTYAQCIDSATQHIAEQLVNDDVQWHFIPPGSPHFGGIWEAGVRSVKHHLRIVMGNNILSFEELTTVLSQIESCLNSRPLCPLTDDPNDFGSLTPGHFLIGDALNAPPQDDLHDVNINGLKRWTLLQKLVLDFWNRWTSEYLHNLQQRPKWQEVQKNPEVGQLVIIKDERLPSLKWMMARITATHPGADGLIRVVDLATSRSTFRRPIHKLCFLPANESYWADNTDILKAPPHHS